MKKRKILAVLVLMIICALFSFFAIGCSEALTTPTDFTIDENYKLAWTSVERARRYMVEIVNVQDGERTEENVTKASISLAELEEGDYEIRVKAMASANSGMADSRWSENIHFEKGFETGCLYTLIDNREYELTKIGTARGDVILESEYRGKPVTSIATGAFKGAGSKLTSVEIGSNVKRIGEKAFWNCTALKSVKIPDSVETIGQRAFSDCKRLIKINFGENSNLKNIGTSAFNGSSLVVVNLPNSVENIGTAAFMNCQQLVVMNVGEGVQTIRNWAFSDCYSLETLALSDSLQSIGKYAFNNCANLPSILLTNNIQSIGEHAFFGCTNITVYTDLEKVPLSWNALWNSSSAVVVFNAQCEESEDGKYVTSVEIKEDSIVNGSKPVIVFDPETGEESNVNPYSAKAPFRVGYKFLGWATSAGGEVVYSMNDILDVPAGTTLYAVWEEDATYAEYIANTIRQKIDEILGDLKDEFDDIWDNIYNDPYYGDYDDSWPSEEELGEEFLEKLKDIINN